MAARQYSRRQAIRYGAGTAPLPLAAGRLGQAAGRLGLPGSPQPAGSPGLAADPARRRPGYLPVPRVLRSHDGLLSVRLTGRHGVVDMRAARPVRTYTYDNVVPGYTWEIRPGDTLRVHLVNHLPPLHHQPPMRMDRPHEWTTMNLHTHGLHVSPSGNADNVFLQIPPGEQHHLEFPLPADHPAGLFWYHPHKHGGVTQLLRAGMAGTIIVRGDIDEVPEVKAARERVMVLQAIELGDDYQLLDPIPDPRPDQAYFPSSRTLYTVNGVLGPKIRMYPGEVQRWRLVNAAPDLFLSLQLKQHDFHVLAWDGLTLPAAEGTGVVMLSPGNRVDLLVRAGRPGRYDLMLHPGSSLEPNIPGMPPAGHGSSGPGAGGSMPGFPAVAGELDPRTVLTVEVAGHGPRMGLPDALPAWDPPILPIARRREFSFTVHRNEKNEFLNFGVDGIPYDPARPPYRPVLGTAEEWTLHNAFDPKNMEHAHVFHIHTNPFKITKRNGTVLDTPLWRDTYVLTKLAGDTITFESNFVDFPGKFVEHCHIVAHEDLGMMSAIEVVPSSDGPAPDSPAPHRSRS